MNWYIDEMERVRQKQLLRIQFQQEEIQALKVSRAIFALFVPIALLVGIALGYWLR